MRVRRWCDYQVKCKEDNEGTWTCTAHLAEGRAFQCGCDPAKVLVGEDGRYRHGPGKCMDFKPPGYDENDPAAYGREK